MVVLFIVFGALPVTAQRSEPEGRYFQTGITLSPGYGINLGALSAHTIYTSEFQLVSDLRSIIQERDERARVAALMGVSLRVFGIERLVGYSGYRGYDFDVGLRTGPGLSFSTRDTRISKNKRFVLLVEPFVRFTTARKNGSVFFVEGGTVAPYVRMGLWWSPFNR